MGSKKWVLMFSWTFEAYSFECNSRFHSEKIHVLENKISTISWCHCDVYPLNYPTTHPPWSLNALRLACHIAPSVRLFCSCVCTKHSMSLFNKPESTMFRIHLSSFICGTHNGLTLLTLYWYQLVYDKCRPLCGSFRPLFWWLRSTDANSLYRQSIVGDVFSNISNMCHIQIRCKYDIFSPNVENIRLSNYRPGKCYPVL